MVCASKWEWKLSHLSAPLPTFHVSGLADHGRFHVSLAEPLSTCLTQSISLRLFICTMMGNFLLNHGLNDYRHKVTADWSFEEHAHYTLWFYMYLITDPRNYAYDLGRVFAVSSLEVISTMAKTLSGKQWQKSWRSRLPLEALPSEAHIPTMTGWANEAEGAISWKIFPDHQV